jgi:hypothetical protein
MPNIEIASQEKANPLIPFIGFVMLLVVGGLSYLVAPAATGWLMTAQWTLAGTAILPFAFPAAWSPVMVRVSVAAGLFLLLFVLVMIVMLLMMGSPKTETDATYGQLRKEKARKRRR